MTAFFDNLETRDPQQREAETFASLPGFIANALEKAPGLRGWLGDCDSSAVTDRAALASLPVLRKPELMEMQAANPPFGGLASPEARETINQGSTAIQCPPTPGPGCRMFTRGWRFARLMSSHTLMPS